MRLLPRPPRLEPHLAANLRRDVLAAFCGGVFYLLLWPFAGVVARRFGVEPSYINLYWALAFGGTFFAIFSGRLLRPGGLIAYAVVSGIALRSLAAPAGLVADPILLLLIMAVSWASLDVTYPIVSDTWRRIYPIERRGQLVGIVRMAAVVGALIGAPIMGYFLDTLGKEVLFPLGALIGVAGWLIYARIKVPPSDAEPPPRYTAGEVIGVLRADARLRVWLACQSVWSIGQMLLWPLTPTILVDHFQASYTDVGLLNALTSLASIVGYGLWGRLSDTRPPLRVLALSMTMTTAVALGYLLSPSLGWLAIPAIFAGLSIAGAEVVGFTVFARLPPPGMFVRYQTASSAVLGIRGMTVPLVGGALVATPGIGLEPVLVLAAALTLAGAVWTSQLRLEPPAARANNG